MPNTASTPGERSLAFGKLSLRFSIAGLLLAVILAPQVIRIHNPLHNQLIVFIAPLALSICGFVFGLVGRKVARSHGQRVPSSAKWGTALGAFGWLAPTFPFVLVFLLLLPMAFIPM